MNDEVRLFRGCEFGAEDEIKELDAFFEGQKSIVVPIWRRIFDAPPGGIEGAAK